MWNLLVSNPHQLTECVYVGLNVLSGVAAMLTYPLDMEVIDAEEREAAELASEA